MTKTGQGGDSLNEFVLEGVRHRPAGAGAEVEGDKERHLVHVGVQLVPEHLGHLVQVEDSLGPEDYNLCELHDPVEDLGEDSVVCGPGPTVLMNPCGFIKTSDNSSEYLVLQIADNMAPDPLTKQIHSHLQQVLPLKCVCCLRSFDTGLCKKCIFKDHQN